MADVPVTLYDACSGGAVIASTVTDANGLYLFEDLCAGEYLVTFDAPAGYEETTPNAACSGTDEDDSDCVNGEICVTLPANDTIDLTNDCGLVELCTGAIGDLVWQDVNMNGCQDPNEPPMADVPVTLYDACAGGAVVASTVTDANGLYLFEDLCAGEYLVTFDAPAGYQETTPNAACSGTDEDDSDCVNGQICVNLPANDTIDLTNDCGLVEIPPPGQGCTPGYWKQPHHFGNWTPPYEPNMPFADVFEDAFPGMTLVEVAGQGGGGLNALGRHTVAALLNAASNEVNYGMSPQEVIDAFNAAYPGTKQEYNQLKDYFEDLNEQGCPLGRALDSAPLP
jgi:hypothetical protein